MNNFVCYQESRSYYRVSQLKHLSHKMYFNTHKLWSTSMHMSIQIYSHWFIDYLLFGQQNQIIKKNIIKLEIKYLSLLSTYIISSRNMKPNKHYLYQKQNWIDNVLMSLFWTIIHWTKITTIAGKNKIITWKCSSRMWQNLRIGDNNSIIRQSFVNSKKMSFILELEII